MIKKWQEPKPWLCPACHTNDLDGFPVWWRLYTCCHCGVQFTKYPWLARFPWIVQDVGVRCVHGHHSVREGIAAELCDRVHQLHAPYGMVELEQVIHVLHADPGDPYTTRHTNQ